MKKNILLSNLSIILLTYNKNYWLKKSINYWSQFNVDLVVVDGSEEKPNDMYSIKKDSLCKLRYFHEIGSYYERLLFASKLSLRKYVLMSCDDEIHLIKGVLKSIKFLENDNNLVASIGRCLKISINSQNQFKEEIIYKRFEKVNNMIAANDMKKRIFNYFEEYICASYYSVIRSKAWKKNLKYICRLKISSPYVYERLIELSHISQGRIYVHNNISWIRNGIIPPKMKSRSRRINWWLKNKNLSHEHSEVLNAIKKITNLPSENYSMFNHIFRDKKVNSWINIKLFLMDFKIFIKIKGLINKILSNNQLTKKTTILKESDFLKSSEINEINNFLKTY